MFDITDDTQHDPAFMYQSNRDGVDRYLLQKIGRTIKRINDPGIFRGMLSHRPFFSDKSCFRKDFAETLHQYFFRGFIHIAYQAVCLIWR
ncbi:MAG: hypothetical protein IPN60_10445 [Saprospiraceae bacterium]|nr:hypothetical protein [Candidatus Opimibacter skivensis]